MRLASVLDEITDVKAAKDFQLAGVLTAALVAVFCTVYAYQLRNPWVLLDAALFAAVSRKVFLGSRLWSRIGLILFTCEKLWQLALTPSVLKSLPWWIYAGGIFCGFVAGVRGTNALAALEKDDSPYERESDL